MSQIKIEMIYSGNATNCMIFQEDIIVVRKYSQIQCKLHRGIIVRIIVINRYSTILGRDFNISFLETHQADKVNQNELARYLSG